MSEQLFTEAIKSAGIPTEKAEFKTKWRAEVVAKGATIANNSEYSPFWRLVDNLITVPSVWLVQLLITTVMPSYFLKTARGGFLELLADAVGIQRKKAQAVEGVIEFSRTDSSGNLTVPAGVVIQSSEIAGKVYEVVSTIDVLLRDGEASALVPCQASEPGAAFNLAAGYYAVLANPVAGITAVSNPSDWITTPGTDIENDDNLRDRARNQFSAVNQWHTDAAYRAIIASFEGVAASHVFFDGNAPRGAGTADAYLYFDVGTPASDFLLLIQNHIMAEGNHGHGDDIQLKAMPETQHDAVANVWLNPNLTELQRDTLILNIELFIRAAFREHTAYKPTLVKPNSRFSESKLKSELHREFADIEDIDCDGINIVSQLTIPRLNSVTVTPQ